VLKLLSKYGKDAVETAHYSTRKSGGFYLEKKQGAKRRKCLSDCKSDDCQRKRSSAKTNSGLSHYFATLCGNSAHQDNWLSID
jgi:hypothetical protein